MKEPKERRVVITGLGVVSCIGNDVKTFWNNLVAGVCGIDVINEFPTDGYPVKIAGKIRNFNPEEYGMDRHFIRKQDPFAIYAMAAAWQAVNDSGIDAVGPEPNVDPFRFGVYMGSGVGGFDTIVREVGHLSEDLSGKWVSPLFIPNMIANMAAGNVAIKFGAKGSCLNIQSACATSSHCIGEAYRAIRHGYADAFIAGGTEKDAIPMGLSGFANARALSREQDPKHACMPFDAKRGGFVMADGSAALIVEEYEHAVARGAHIYAEIVGYGTTCDAYHATAPRPDGSTQAECIRQALEEASFDASKDELYINAHGTGTRMNDSAETQAIKMVLGDEAYRAHVSSTKSMHGHMLGATGAAEAIATVLALQEGIIPPTINLDDPDPECDLDYTPNWAVEAHVNIGISDSFGFGGHNACVAFRKI